MPLCCKQLHIRPGVHGSVVTSKLGHTAQLRPLLHEGYAATLLPQQGCRLARLACMPSCLSRHGLQPGQLLLAGTIKFGQRVACSGRSEHSRQSSTQRRAAPTLSRGPGCSSGRPLRGGGCPSVPILPCQAWPCDALPLRRPPPAAAAAARRSPLPRRPRPAGWRRL